MKSPDRLVHYLKTHQLYDQSTIVLLSDHGEGSATTASRSTASSSTTRRFTCRSS